ncbi:hypothetical protein Cjcuy013_04920 [Campylobacter jejuni]|nr:hypothetical protein [Campylobacter jejuni]MBC5861021.1 hypothetical protein [Campylobacter jejuni]
MLSTVCSNVPSLVAYSVAKDLFKRLNLNISVYLGANETLKELSKARRQRLDDSVKNFKLEHLWENIKSPEILENINPDVILKWVIKILI